jgi:preprotein translocase subunit SecG
MIIGILTFLHVVVCIFLVVVVLLQSGKAADLAGAFGGMGSQTAFGPRGTATVLSKATTFAATVFMITSLTLAIISTRSGGGSASVLERSGSKKSAPAKPAAPAPAGQQQAPAPGGAQPTVTLTPETDGKLGPSKTIPIPPEALKPPPAKAPASTPAPAKK